MHFAFFIFVRNERRQIISATEFIPYYDVALFVRRYDGHLTGLKYVSRCIYLVMPFYGAGKLRSAKGVRREQREIARPEFRLSLTTRFFVLSAYCSNLDVR